MTTDEAVLRFTISDTGIGIPHDKQWQIFGAFVQADASTTRRFGGTGLGLTISAHLVEMMGGRIWLTSEPGRGSRFRFVARFGVQHRRMPIRRRWRRSSAACARWWSTTTRRTARSCGSCWAAGECTRTSADGARTALTMMKEAAAGAARVRPGAGRCRHARSQTGSRWRATSPAMPRLSGAKVIVLTSPDAPSRETRGLRRDDRRAAHQAGEAVGSDGCHPERVRRGRDGDRPPRRRRRSRNCLRTPAACASCSRTTIARTRGWSSSFWNRWRSRDGGEQRPRGGGTSGGGAVRPDPDGRPDAGNGWIRGNRRDSRTRADRRAFTRRSWR